MPSVVERSRPATVVFALWQTAQLLTRIGRIFFSKKSICSPVWAERTVQKCSEDARTSSLRIGNKPKIPLTLTLTVDTGLHRLYDLRHGDFTAAQMAVEG